MKTNTQDRAIAALTNTLDLRQLLLPQPVPITFGQALDGALNRSMCHCLTATRQTYRRPVTILLQVFGKSYIHQIPTVDYEVFLESLHQANGERLSASSRNRYVYLIRMAMEEAGLAPGVVHSFPLIRREPCFYTAAEVATMIGAVRPEERGYVILQSHFGLRLGEAQRLEPANIDLSAETIWVRGANSSLGPRTISGGQNARDSQAVVPGGAWRLLAAFPFQPLQRARRTVHEAMRRAAGRWIPGGLRRTAAANLVSFHRCTNAASTLGLDPAILTTHFVRPITPAEARDYFEMDPGQFAQSA